MDFIEDCIEGEGEDIDMLEQLKAAAKNAGRMKGGGNYPNTRVGSI